MYTVIAWEYSRTRVNKCKLIYLKFQITCSKILKGWSLTVETINSTIVIFLFLMFILMFFYFIRFMFLLFLFESFVLFYVDLCFFLFLSFFIYSYNLLFILFCLSFMYFWSCFICSLLPQNLFSFLLFFSKQSEDPVSLKQTCTH